MKNLIQRKYNIFIFLVIILFFASCASKPKGMRKSSKKKGCDCPSFSFQKKDSSSTFIYHIPVIHEQAT